MHSDKQQHADKDTQAHMFKNVKWFFLTSLMQSFGAHSFLCQSINSCGFDPSFIIVAAGQLHVSD